MNIVVSGAGANARAGAASGGSGTDICRIV